MKVGIEIRVDVTKIDKTRIYDGKKGKYITLTSFVNLYEEDQYGNHGFITHKKDQGEDNLPIIGNTKVFWTSEGQQQSPQGYDQRSQEVRQQVQDKFGPEPEDDIPF